MNPTRFRFLQRQINRQLLSWALLSITAGISLWRRGTPFWRAFALQQAVWGAIDGAIAGVGSVSARRQAIDTATEAATEARKLRRLLWINAGLDVGYVLSGAWLMRRRAGKPAAESFRGHGLGVLLQGGFLLIFDLVHALRLGAALRQEAR